MGRGVFLAGFCAAVSVAAVAEAREGNGAMEVPSATLVLLDDLMIDDDAAEDWRLPDDPFAEDTGGDLRVRVKLRPNRAMGRMSLSF